MPHMRLLPSHSSASEKPHTLLAENKVERTGLGAGDGDGVNHEEPASCSKANRGSPDGF